MTDYSREMEKISKKREKKISDAKKEYDKKVEKIQHCFNKDYMKLRKKVKR